MMPGTIHTPISSYTDLHTPHAISIALMHDQGVGIERSLHSYDARHYPRQRTFQLHDRNEVESVDYGLLLRVTPEYRWC